MAGNANSGGRNRKPAALRLLQGTARPSRMPRAGAAAAPPADRLPRPPAWLAKDARRHWTPLARQAMALRVLADTDAPTLALACAAIAEYQAADAIVQREGLTLTRTDPSGQPIVQKHPAVSIRADAWRRARDALRAFGLSPADRDHVSKATDPKRENPFAALRGVS